MMMSSFSSLGTRSCSVASTTPAGTISQMARGFWSFFTKSSSESEPVAPSPTSCLTVSALRSYTTQVWPLRIRRRTMLAPIRPRPIIPSCILSAPKLRIVRGKLPRESRNRLLHGFAKHFESGLQVLAEVHAQSAAPAFGENVEIAAGLGRLDDAERIFLAGHGEIGSVIAGNLQKDTAVRAAFVGLSRGMQEARSEAEACRDFLFVANNMAEFLKDFFVFGVHGNVAENGKVIASTGAGEMFFQRIHQLCAATEGRRILFIGE